MEIDWTVVISAGVAAGFAVLPATIIAFRTHYVVKKEVLPTVNGRMEQLIEAREKAAEARALLHERASQATARLLKAEIEARERIAKAASVAARSTLETG